MNQLVVDHVGCVECERIGVVVGDRGDIRLDGMGHSIHTGMRGQLLRHRLCQLGVNDRDIGRDVVVGERVLDALVIVGDDRECGDFGCRARGRRNCAEVCLRAELREAERRDDRFKAGVRIFVEHPHRLCCVDRRTAAHCHDPVGLELAHCLGAAHHGLDRRVGLDTLEQFNLHAAVLQILYGAIQEAHTLHRAAADNDDRTLAAEVLQLLERSLTKVYVSG